ncbi:MAG: biopolymer transporter ExbD [Lentisphaerae bacterium]|nr:biopolymer transporter ExbD [Lentisphaerota bacterium]
MKRVVHADGVGGGVVEINIAPLIDCVFLLLIFFIVTTTFVRDTAVDIERPAAATAAVSEKDSLQFSLSSDGRIFHNGQEVRLNGVRGIVLRQTRDRSLPVVIVADADSRNGVLVDLIDECRRGGAGRVGIAAEKK